MEALIAGVVYGAALALMALGLTLIFGVARTINFAHGEFYALGGYTLIVALGVGRMPAIVGLVAAPIVGAALGWLLHAALLRVRSTFSRFAYSDYFLIVTFAVSVLMSSGFLLIFGPTYRTPPSFWDGSVDLGAFSVGGDRVVTFLASLLCAVALTVFMRTTYTGRSWRAMAQSRLGAEVVGIDVGKASRLVFAVACGIAGLAGALLSPLYSVYPESGIAPMATGFTIIVLGGMGSVLGALLGGLIVGVVEMLGIVYVSSNYAGAYAFGVMVLVLLVRPNGLFGVRERAV